MSCGDSITNSPSNHVIMGVPIFNNIPNPPLSKPTSFNVSRKHISCLQVFIPQYSGYKIEMSRSISGASPRWRWHSMISEHGYAQISVYEDDVVFSGGGGMYQIRILSQEGDVLKMWHSIPLWDTYATVLESIAHQLTLRSYTPIGRTYQMLSTGPHPLFNQFVYSSKEMSNLYQVEIQPVQSVVRLLFFAPFVQKITLFGEKISETLIGEKGEKQFVATSGSGFYYYAERNSYIGLFSPAFNRWDIFYINPDGSAVPVLSNIAAHDGFSPYMEDIYRPVGNSMPVGTDYEIGTNQDVEMWSMQYESDSSMIIPEYLSLTLNGEVQADSFFDFAFYIDDRFVDSVDVDATGIIDIHVNTTNFPTEGIQENTLKKLTVRGKVSGDNGKRFYFSVEKTDHVVFVNRTKGSRAYLDPTHLWEPFRPYGNWLIRTGTAFIGNGTHTVDSVSVGSSRVCYMKQTFETFDEPMNLKGLLFGIKYHEGTQQKGLSGIDIYIDGVSVFSSGVIGANDDGGIAMLFGLVTIIPGTHSIEVWGNSYGPAGAYTSEESIQLVLRPGFRNMERAVIKSLFNMPSTPVTGAIIVFK